MIQRIQSVFLFLAAVACLVLFALPVATTNTPEAASALFSDGQYTLSDDPVLMGFFAFAGLLLLGGIFLFRNRPLQIRLSWLSIAIILGGVGYGFYLLSADQAQNEAQVGSGIALPLLAIILAYLAKTYIHKDERLVRSADRLR